MSESGAQIEAVWAAEITVSRLRSELQVVASMMQLELLPVVKSLFVACQNHDLSCCDRGFWACDLARFEAQNDARRAAMGSLSRWENEFVSKAQSGNGCEILRV